MAGEVQPTRSYRRGDWFGIFGEGATLLLPASEKARVPDLWVLVDDGAGFDRLLDALVGGGLSALPGFVLVGHDEPSRVVVRGAATAVLTRTDGTTEELDGAAAATWVERSVSDLAALSLRVAEPVAEHDIPIEDGLVRVARVDQPPYGTRADGRLAVAAEAAVEEPRVGGPVAAPPVSASPITEPPPSAPPSSGPPRSGPPSSGSPSGPPPVGRPPGFPPPPPATAPAGMPAAESAAPPMDHDGLTRAGGWDPRKHARQHPGIPGQPLAPSVTAQPVARLQFSSGESVDVDRAVLIGRAPEARRFTATEQPRLVTVPSPQQEISSTHLEVRPGSGADHGAAVVTDMGSTNGTVLHQPGLPQEDLQPGIPVQLLPGAVINLGDGVTVRVVRP